MRSEVRALIRHSEFLIGYLHSEYGLTDEEYDAISEASKALEIELLLYRLEKLPAAGKEQLLGKWPLTRRIDIKVTNHHLFTERFT
jgi:hypothetical protein